MKNTKKQYYNQLFFLRFLASYSVDSNMYKYLHSSSCLFWLTSIEIKINPVQPFFFPGH